jgi:argininosuccinate lyase
MSNEIEAKSAGEGRVSSGAMDPAAAALNASVAFDRRLLRDDVARQPGARPDAGGGGLIGAEDARAIVEGLDRSRRSSRAAREPWIQPWKTCT